MKVHYKTGTIAEPTPAAPSAAVYLVRPRRMGDAGRRLAAEKHRASPQRRKAAPAPATKARSLLTRTALAGAVLAAAAGCATLDAETAKAWKIEPVLHVTHAFKSSEAYYTLGRYHDGSREWDKAIDAYRKAIAVDAQNVEAYNALGVSLARSGRYADAETTLRQAVALAPQRAHVRSNLGYVLLLAGMPREAVAELRAAVAQDGSNATASANLRDALAQADALGYRAAPVAQATAPSATVPTGEAAAPTATATVAGAAVSGVSAPAETIDVPMPITVAQVPAPLTAPVNVATPLQTAAIPAPAGTGIATAAAASPAAPVLALQVFDQPTIGSLEERAVAAPRAATGAPSAVASNTAGTPPAGTPLAAAPAAPTTRAADEPVVAVAMAVRAATAAAGEELASRLEVSNGNGIAGMAARVGRWLATQGVDTARLTNQKPFVQEKTVVQYRSGHEGAAQRIARSLPADAVAAAEPTPGLRGDVDVRVLLGRDWVNVASCLSNNSCRPTVAAVAEAAPR